MLKKLRIKFIAIIMIMSALVIAVAFSAICFTEYQRTLSSVQSELGETTVHATALLKGVAQAGESAAAAAGDASGTDAASGTAPEVPIGGDDAAADAGASTGSGSGSGASASSSFSGPKIGGHGDDKNSQYPTAVYLINSDGTTTMISDLTTATISDDVLENAISYVTGASDGFGTADGTGLYYSKRNTDAGTIVAFVDSSITSSWKSLALNLALVGGITLVIFFIISIFFSKWAVRPVSEAWEAQKQFVTDASHELKTPLTVILANTSILLKHPEKNIASQSKWLESTQVEAQNMEGLVSEMLSLAQVESRPTLQKEKFDLSDMVNGQALQFESVAFEQGFELESDVEDGVVVDGDQKRLHKMLSTLIENASKYVNAGGTVRVTLASNGKTATIGIFNTGSYIAPEDLEHVFDRFYRTDKARTSGAGGFGLGLAIAREIARSHGGDIVAQSEKGKGTTFTVTVALESK